jgi:hypothetical protein
VSFVVIQFVANKLLLNHFFIGTHTWIFVVIICDFLKQLAIFVANQSIVKIVVVTTLL